MGLSGEFVFRLREGGRADGVSMCLFVCLFARASERPSARMGRAVETCAQRSACD